MHTNDRDELTDALRDELARVNQRLEEQPEQQRPQNCGTGYCSCIECLFERPARREWVGLTRMELIECGVLPFGMSYELYQAIEAMLKEKNT